MSKTWTPKTTYPARLREGPRVLGASLLMMNAADYIDSLELSLRAAEARAEAVQEELKNSNHDITRLMDTCTTETNRAEELQAKLSAVLEECVKLCNDIIPHGQTGLRQRLKQAIRSLDLSTINAANIVQVADADGTYPAEKQPSTVTTHTGAVPSCVYRSGCTYLANHNCEHEGRCLGGWPFPEQGAAPSPAMPDWPATLRITELLREAANTIESCFSANDHLIKDRASAQAATERADRLQAENDRLRGGWIPVSERLPEAGSLCVAADADGKVMVASSIYRNETYQTLGFIAKHGQSLLFGATYWTPITEPPARKDAK